MLGVATVYHQENMPFDTVAEILDRRTTTHGLIKYPIVQVRCIGGDSRCRDTHWTFASLIKEVE